jgi:uridine kinase
MREIDSLTHSEDSPVRKCMIVGICGGSGSGKTTLLHRLVESYPGKARAIFQDSYYIDQSANFKEDGGEINFDHPDSLDFDLMAKQLRQIKALKPIEIPIYDFVTHKRKTETEAQKPGSIILVDGTLILAQEQVREIFDYSIFLQVPEHIRFERRKNRDMKERGRQLDGIVRQFYNHVKPMHDEFVEPSKMHADQVFAEVHEFEKAYISLKKILDERV